MKYDYASEDEPYALFAGGQVFHAYPGQAAFPARLASEILQRCAAHLAARQRPGPYRLYDPCCGAAAHLATMAFLHRRAIAALIASDIDPLALEFAAKNLQLLNARGMDRRIAQLSELLQRYGKASHRQSLAHARTLRARIDARPLPTHLFRADATQPLPLAAASDHQPIDIVFADIPYGRRSQWQRANMPLPSDEEMAQQMLDNLHAVLPPHSIVAVASANRHKINHPDFQRLKQLRAGKRRITLLTPAPI